MSLARLYLDHAATTPMLPRARAEVAEAMERWANPSSPHAEGRAARAALEDARARISAQLGHSGPLIFTSGASEAIEIAMRRGKAARRTLSAVEHDAVRRVARDAAILPVDRLGQVQEDAVGGADTLHAIQLVNNETGVVQPIDALRERIAERGGLLLMDAAQAAGKMTLPAADFVSISAHKLGGPPGIGALLVRDLALLEPSGGQEQGYRGGTENLPAIIGFAAALEEGDGWMSRASRLRDRLDSAIRDSGGTVVADEVRRAPAIASYRMPGVAATAQLIRFDMAGISVSAGSACSSGSLKPSHVLAAMGWSEAEAREVVRVSFGPQTEDADIDRFVSEWRKIAASARTRAA